MVGWREYGGGFLDTLDHWTAGFTGRDWVLGSVTVMYLLLDLTIAEANGARIEKKPGRAAD